MDKQYPTNAPAAGWYQDRSAPDLLRWWDGRAWTEATRPASPSAPPPRRQPATAVEARDTDLVVDTEPAVRIPWRSLVAVVAAVVLVLGAAAGVRRARTPAVADYAAAVCARARAAADPSFAAGAPSTSAAAQARTAAFVAVSLAAALVSDMPPDGSALAALEGWREEINTAAGQLTAAADTGAAPELALRRRALADRLDAPPVSPSVRAALREAQGCSQLWAVLRSA
jgi:hypothetical protein